ncbi:MAG: hypothetical protein AB1512_08210 [Thermodesulfobacteriota bacterium]
MKKPVGSILCLILLLSLPACQRYGSRSIPEELHGVWVTEAENYERCSLEITGEKLIFENGVTFIDINYIKGVEKTVERGTPLYTIHYQNSAGEHYKVSVYYMKDGKGGMLCLKNQRRVTWTRRADA